MRGVERLNHPGYSMKILPCLTAMLLCFTVLVRAETAELAIASRQQELMHLLLADCGSCHGMTLKGGLGPSLLQADLAGKPDELLFITIRDGRGGTPMPPWRDFLTDDEIRWMVDVLRDEKWNK